MESWKIKFLKDMNMLKVFKSVGSSPKTAKQISEECDMPRTTVYKKLKLLQGKNLIKTTGILQNGRRYRIYKNKD
jgi:predicted transcriptional regulator